MSTECASWVYDFSRDDRPGTGVSDATSGATSPSVAVTTRIRTPEVYLNYLRLGTLIPITGALNSCGVIIRIMSAWVGAVRGTSPMRRLSSGVMS